MQPVVTAAEMRALDRATMDEVGIPGFTLMETAGRAVADAAIAMLGGARGHVAVVCGPGNNGGDGFVVARVLRNAGIDAVAYLAVKRDAVQGHAKDHLDVLERSGGVIRMIVTPQAFDDQRDAIAGAELAVDALFGIGPVRPLEGHLAAVVGAINACRRRLAIDIPSGLDSDTGRTMGVAVDAHRTVTMGPLKVALVSAPGFARCGEVTSCDIGIPEAVVDASSVRAGLVERADIARWLPRSTALDHKGTRGHVLVISGEMHGAGRLAAMAALRAGAGLVTLAGSADANGAIDAPDSIMTRVLDDQPDLRKHLAEKDKADAWERRMMAAVRAGDAQLARHGLERKAEHETLANQFQQHWVSHEQALENLAAALEGKAAVVIGPGLGKTDTAKAWVIAVLASGVPAVLDADALNLLASPASEPPHRGLPLDSLAFLSSAAGPVVITPHPGEAARLLGITTAEVEADRLAAARTLAAKTKSVVVLKGARTIVCDGSIGDDHCAINPTGGPALGTAGSGDVLAGTIAALLAQGLVPGDAARVGVYVHGAAGDALAKIHGRGTISLDLPLAIAAAIHAI